MEDNKNYGGYPDPFAPQEDKLTKDYGVRYCRGSRRHLLLES